MNFITKKIAYRKLKTSYLSIIMILLFFSCSQTEDLSPLPAVDSEFNFKLSENDALKLIQNFMMPSSRNASLNSPSVRDVHYLELPSKVQTRTSYSGDVMVYQIDLNNDEKGYALVSGDKRMPCVIAYSEKGEISDTLINKGAAMMIKNAESVFLESIENAKSAVEYPEGLVIQMLGPLVHVQWGQESPYNDLMPASTTFTGSYYNSKFPVACLPVSIAQILSYFQPTMVINGTTINWSELTALPYISPYSSSSLKNQVALLMRYTSDCTKTRYIEGLGGSTTIDDGISFLKQNGLSINNVQTLHIPEVIASLSMWQPILATGSAQGGAHSWILDGFQRRKNADVINTYVHANFGWSGMENGYYLANTNNISFETEYNGTFSTNLKIYSRIRK